MIFGPEVPEESMAEAEDGDGWSSWMSAAQAAAVGGVHVTTIYRWRADGAPWLRERERPGSSYHEYSLLLELYQQQRVPGGRGRKVEFDVYLEPEVAYPTEKVCDLAGCTSVTVTEAAREGRLVRVTRGVYKLPRSVHHWQGISALSDLLEVPRSTLERRLFEQDTVDALQWAHYQVREAEVSSLKWNARIAPGYTPAALTRADVARLLD